MPKRMATGRLSIALVVLGLAAGGCEREAPAVPEELAVARQQAARGACVAAELLRRASDDVTSLEETLASTSATGPAAEVTRQAGTAALQFARAYEQHAELRAVRAAHLDSAFNYAQRAADSIQHAEWAQRIAIRAPESGTLEANVFTAYEQDFRSLFQDPDHPCNWDLEE